MAADHRLKLLVKNLPPELGDEDKKDLMKSFGAIDVVCFGRKGRMVCSYLIYQENCPSSGNSHEAG